MSHARAIALLALAAVGIAPAVVFAQAYPKIERWGKIMRAANVRLE